MIFVCGSFTGKQKKPCKFCKHFFLWGISEGFCDKHNKDMMCHEHCKYYKRDSETWLKSGKCKFDESQLYV